jgi:hypothetical protein
LARATCSFACVSGCVTRTSKSKLGRVSHVSMIQRSFRDENQDASRFNYAGSHQFPQKSDQTEHAASDSPYPPFFAVTNMARALDLVTFDAAGALPERIGISAAEWDALAPRLEAVRREVIDGNPSSDGTEPLGHNIHSEDFPFIELPERTLDDYVERRESSELGRVLSVAKRLREQVDRVLVLGTSGFELSGRAILDACCEPYFNELSRGQRGGRPRMYFAGDHLDNDATAGLLTLLTEGRSPDRLDDRWAILVNNQRGKDSKPAAAAFRLFSAALRSFCRDDAERVAELIVPVTGTARHSGQDAGRSPRSGPRQAAGLQRPVLHPGWDRGRFFRVFGGRSASGRDRRLGCGPVARRGIGHERPFPDSARWTQLGPGFRRGQPFDGMPLRAPKPGWFAPDPCLADLVKSVGIGSQVVR